jgi:hypothetical protein
MIIKLKSLFVLLSLGAVLAVACKKNATEIGLEVYDPEMLLDAKGVDTFSIVCFSETLDSAVITKSARYGLLGVYKDPKVGEVSAGFYTQLRLAADNPDLGDLNTITIDSVVLALEYSDMYGSGGVDLAITVQRITEDLNDEILYKSNSVTAADPNNLIDPAFQNFIPNPNVPTVISDTIVLEKPQLRLRLLNSLGADLLTAAQGSTNDNFLLQFKGLRVAAENANVPPNSGAVYQFDLIDADTKLIVYYKQNDEQKSFDFIINTNSVRYNTMAYNTGGSALADLLTNPLLGANAFYAQTGNARAVVRMPSVQQLSNKTIIHRATLYLPVEYFPGDDRFPSPNIVAFNRRVNDDEKIWGLVSTASGIVPSTFTYNNTFKRYTVDVTSFVQGLIRQNPYFQTPELLITGARTNDNVERIVFNGVNSTNKYQPKLIITYTVF